MRKQPPKKFWELFVHFKKNFDGNLINRPYKFRSNYWEIVVKIWTFYRKVVKKCEINFWETASVEKLRNDLMKLRKNLQSSENDFRKVPKKCSEIKQLWRNYSLAFMGVFLKNWEIIFQKFWKNSRDILKLFCNSCWKIFRKFQENFRLFCKSFGEIAQKFNEILKEIDGKILKKLPKDT